MKPDLDIEQYFSDGLGQMGLALSEEQLIHILKFFQLLLAANEKINLISSKPDLKTKVAIHLLDSLSPLLLKKLKPEIMIMDFGSGGGLPSIPLSFLWPQSQFTLIEATGKKINFLSEVKQTLNIINVKLSNSYLNPNSNPEGFIYDLIMVRAVSSLKNILAVAGPRLKLNGQFLAFKGPQADEEINEASTVLKKYKMKLIERLDFNLPLIGAERCLLLFQKN